MIGSQGWGNCIGDIEKEHFIQAGVRLPGYVYGVAMDSPYFKDLLVEGDYLAAYRSCPPLKSILGKRARSFNNGIWSVENINTEKPATGSEAKMIKKLLEKPNVLQNKQQFFAQQNQYVDLFGYCPVLKMRPAGMVDEISQIWNIPPWLFDLDYTGKWLNQNTINGIYTKYRIIFNGKTIDLDPKNLFFVFDDGFGTDFDTNLTIPDSRLIGHEYIISNITASYKSRNTLITKRGALGILSNEAGDGMGAPMPIDEPIRNALQKDFKSYGIVGQPYQIIITDAKLKWQQMGFATKDLMLFEEIEDDIHRLCDIYGWPPELIARSKDTTFDNKRQARKDLYENTIIPEAGSRNSQFSRGIVSEESNIKLSQSFDHLIILQEDKQKQADTRKRLDEALSLEYKEGLITKNMWLEELGMEKSTNPDFDKYIWELEPEETPSI